MYAHEARRFNKFKVTSCAIMTAGRFDGTVLNSAMDLSKMLVHIVALLVAQLMHLPISSITSGLV